MNFARLNHILIPSTKEGRDRFRRGWVVRLVRPISWLGEVSTQEGRSLVLLVFAMALAGVEVRATQVFLLWTTLGGFLLTSFVGRRWFRMDDVRLEVRSPARVTEGEALEISVLLTNTGTQAHHAIRVLGPFLPWDGSWLGRAPRIPTLQPGEQALRVARARFIERGEHHLDVFHAAALLPLGLVVGPQIESQGCRFCVVPRPANVASIELPGRGGAAARQPGSRPRQGRGGNLELLGVRGYRPGDPARDLHVRTWARTGLPHVREYQQTQEGRLVVVLDAAGERDEPSFEASIRLTAGVCFALTDRGEVVDLIASGGAQPARGLGSHADSLTAALDLLARIGPDPGSVEDLWRKLQTELTDDVDGVIVVCSGATRAAQLENLLRRSATAWKLLRVVRKHSGAAGPEVLAQDILSGRSLSL